jgi:hypothetical protein
LHESGDISLVQKARGHRDIRTTLIYTQCWLIPASLLRYSGRLTVQLSQSDCRVADPRGTIPKRLSESGFGTVRLASGAEGCRFEPCRARFIFGIIQKNAG